MNKRKFGALPPREIEWQDRKTIESIRFVNDAEKFLLNCKDAKKNTIASRSNSRSKRWKTRPSELAYARRISCAI